MLLLLKSMYVPIWTGISMTVDFLFLFLFFFSRFINSQPVTEGRMFYESNRLKLDFLP